MNELTMTEPKQKTKDSRGDFMASLTPKQIVEELDKFIVGQNNAKRAVAIALRNRWRRQQLPEALRDEVGPKNILMIGPTGVGKTEIARRLAKLSKSPFIKVEASKYTEVGYVGRDVESMVRDLVELSKGMIKEEMEVGVREKAREQAIERLLDLLLPPPPGHAGKTGFDSDPNGRLHYDQTREKFKQMLKDGRLDEREIDVDVAEKRTPMIDVVFLLIIFFMVSTVFVDFSRKMDINLPTSKSSALDESAKTLEVEMLKDKKIFLSGKPLTLLGLETTLAKMELKDKKPTAIIRADKSLPYGDVIQVMGILQKKGIPDISVAVK